MAARPRPCDREARAGRLRKAEQFADAYNLVRDYAGDDGELDVADAAVTLAVHAGIAASDVICCARLGVRAQGDSHDEAKTLLSAAMAGMDKYLATLLAMKTRAGYSADPATRDMLVRAGWSHGPRGKVYFGPRGRLLRRDATCQIADTLLPFDPQTLPAVTR